jgi:hypothetical protein
MANPLPPGLPPGFWQDYCRRYEDDIAHLREDLERFQRGELRVVGNNRDETLQWVSRLRQTIEKYQRSVDAVNGASCPDASRAS